MPVWVRQVRDKVESTESQGDATLGLDAIVKTLAFTLNGGHLQEQRTDKIWLTF